MGGNRAPAKSIVNWNAWSQDYWLGNVPTGLSLFGYMTFAATCTHRNELIYPTAASDGANRWSSGYTPVGNGSYGAFQSLICEMEVDRFYYARPNVHFCRTIELVFYNNSVYLRARQGGQTVYYEGWQRNGVYIDTLISKTNTSYDFVMTANVGVVP